MRPHEVLARAQTAEQYAAARALIEEYAAELESSSGVDLAFQNLTAELEQLRTIYAPPGGCLLLARRGERWSGCAALRRVSDEVCEMKRLFVRCDSRGTHLSRRLAERLLSEARLLGYERMVLDTLEEMTAARGLYRSLGFRDTDPYYFNPLPGAVFMELLLNQAAP